jgi:SAM-dependent methyltransferase
MSSFAGRAAGFEEFTDPRLVGVYDDWDRVRLDLTVYRDLAAATGTGSIVDVGCGTGRLAVDLARAGHRVTGVDPAPAMLAAARSRDGGGLVRWVEGDAAQLGAGEYDLAVMSGHVVQVIADDRALIATFGAIRRALRTGGRLAFDSRNPTARAWTRWTPEESRRVLPSGVETWFQGTRAAGSLVTYEIHYRFPDGDELVSHTTLRFRPYGWLTRALVDAGFQVEPVDHDTADLMFLATARPTG